MGLPEIFLEHKKDPTHGRPQQRYLRLKPGRKLFIIGSSQEADVKITGEGIQGCHAALRYRAPHWYVCDISGSESVKINGQPMAEAMIDGTAAIEIADHRIQLFTKAKPELFKESDSDGQLSLHQVVVRGRDGRVLQTKVLQASEAFSYNDGESVTILPAPSSGKWSSRQVGTRTVQQRLVGAQEIMVSEGIEFDRGLRKPFAFAIMFFVLLIGSMLFVVPNSPDPKNEVVLDKKSLDIIYNAKAIKKKKIEAQKVVKTAKAKAGGTSEQAPNQNTARSNMPEESQAPKASDKPSPALTSLRQMGLANLVGKIAKRANKQGIMVAAQGVTPDTQGAGRAFYNTGTATTGGGGTAAKEGPSFRLGGIATKGKAGGTGNFKDGTALAGGNVGSGDIVAMVDEETVVEGGLDRDAIAEVIRRNLGQIRYCYERQLSSNPELYGKVLVKFTIGSAGDVSEPRVDNTTLKSAMVEGCIMRRMASWKFPEPKGGTEVRVSYPFLFKAN